MPIPSSARTGWTVRSRLMLGICLIVALGIAAAGSVAFLIERSDALSALDAHLKSRVTAASAIVHGPANADDATAPAVPFTSSAAAARAVVAGIVPDIGESTFALVQGKTSYVPGVKTTVRLEKVAGLVATVTHETA